MLSSTQSTRQKTKLSFLLSILVVASLISIAVIVGGPPTLTNQALASGEMADGTADYYYYGGCPDMFCVILPLILNMLDTE